MRIDCNQTVWTSTSQMTMVNGLISTILCLLAIHSVSRRSEDRCNGVSIVTAYETSTVNDMVNV